MKLTPLLLLDLSFLFVWDALSLKNLDNLLSSRKINLTDLNFLKRFKRSLVVHISSLLCSCSFLWQIRLEDLKGTIGGDGEISCLSIGGNNSMLPLCISLSFSNSVNISSIVKSTTELLLNILMFYYCYGWSVYMVLGQDQMWLELLSYC